METVGDSILERGIFLAGSWGAFGYNGAMRRRFQFSLRALFVAALIAAIYSFAAYKIRDDRSPTMTPSDRRFLAHERERLRREHLKHIEHNGKPENR